MATFFLPGAYPERGRSRLALDGRRLRTLPLNRPTDFSVLINGNVLFPPGLVLARRWAYERVGPFDESFRGAEDWDMLIRLSRLGHLSFVDQVILHYRRHDANAGAAAGIERAAWLVRCKAFDSPEKFLGPATHGPARMARLPAPHDRAAGNARPRGRGCAKDAGSGRESASGAGSRLPISSGSPPTEVGSPTVVMGFAATLQRLERGALTARRWLLEAEFGREWVSALAVAAPSE